MERFDWCCLEATTNLSDCVVLSNLEDFQHFFSCVRGEPSRKGIGEDRKHNRVIYLMPVGKAQTTYRITQDVERSDGRACSCSHDLGMVCPVKFLVKKSA